MRRRHLLQHPGRVVLFIAFVASTSCDNGLFGIDSRDIGGGYRLKRGGNPNQFALITPHENGGLIVDEIGWRYPVIVARGTGSQYWDAIDTAHAQHIRISDATRKSTALYQTIEIKGAEKAWESLNGQKRLW
jgi:hypothetical protein